MNPRRVHGSTPSTFGQRRMKNTAPSIIGMIGATIGFAYILIWALGPMNAHLGKDMPHGTQVLTIIALLGSPLFIALCLWGGISVIRRELKWKAKLPLLLFNVAGVLSAFLAILFLIFFEFPRH